MDKAVDKAVDKAMDKAVDIEPYKGAVTSIPIHPYLAERWSPRAFDARHVIDPEVVTCMLEAARWSPSANNMQPWRFSVLLRDEALHKEACEKGLMGFNRVWAPRASLLIIISAKTTTPDGKPNAYARFDTGLAVSNLIIQGEMLGYSAHVMGGIHADVLKGLLNLPEDVEVIAAMTVGLLASVTTLQGALYDKEMAPRTRLPLEEVVLHGVPDLHWEPMYPTDIEPEPKP